MTKRRGKFPRFAAVHWLDAQKLDAGGNENGTVAPIHALTFGFILAVDEQAGERFLRIAGEIFEDGSARDVTAIPSGMVRTIVAMPLKLPEQFSGWQNRKIQMPDESRNKKKRKSRR